jgi:hypothetical protein
LEAVGEELCLWNSVTKSYLPTPEEKLARMESENEQLRREIEALKQQAKQKP